MGLLDWFFSDNDFKKKPKVTTPTLPSTQTTEVVQQQNLNNTNSCPYCEIGIEGWQKSRKWNGKRFHNKCLKKMKKEALKMRFN